MKLYLLERNDIGYDELTGVVIRAANEKQARQLANNIAATEGKVWEDNDTVSCMPIPVDGVATIILSAFNAG